MPARTSDSEFKQYERSELTRQRFYMFRASSTLGELPISGKSIAEINAMIGETFTDKGFTSFSLSREVVEKSRGKDDFTIVLKAKKGLKGASLANTSAYNDYERQEEFLVARNTGYRILGAKEIDGKKYLFVEAEQGKGARAMGKGDGTRKNMMALQKVEAAGVSDMTQKEFNRLSNGIREVAKKTDMFGKGYDIGFEEYTDGTLMEWKNGKLTVSTVRHRLEDGTVFCPAEKLQSAIAKLKSGQELDFYEEYSIENLFHESVHARATRKTIIRAGSMDEKVMETCTQLYARDRYVKIMKAYGVKPVNFDKIMTDGLGYNFECRKLRRFFLKDGELQVGELINIANETESGTRIMVKKLMRMGIKEEDAINLLWNLL